ncbi:MAG: hypothetical protein H7Y12_07265 [Sphingobacteriaceae bacterium]|nr:hypothetical protein [Cytophagaceae bacterium]
MASFLVNLVIDGEELPLNRVNFFAMRNRDSKGRVSSNLAWTVAVSLDTTPENTFTDWMIDPNKKKDVSIKFYEGDEAEKEWQFTQAYCIGFKESFVADSGKMETRIVISGELVTNGNATLKYDWAS